MPARGKGKAFQGMNWIRQDKRLAIYLRDGLACVWCGRGLEDGAALTLDHVVPCAHGGSHHESNLVTCCSECNSQRGAKTAASWARWAFVEWKNVMEQVDDFRTRPLAPYRIKAKRMMARRGGSVAKALGRVA